MRSLIWVAIFVVPLLYNIGISNFFYIIIGIVTFTLGFIGQMINHGYEQLEKEEANGAPVNEPCPDSHGLPGLIKRMVEVEAEIQAVNKKATKAKQLTGSKEIDEALTDVIECIMRDFIHSWYSRLSSEPVFPNEVKTLLEKILVKFAQRLHDVDWIMYCTQTLTNDFGSHVRLYKRTLRKLKENGDKNELERIFFDMEVEMEGNLCREQICTNKEAEKDYLRQISDVIIFLLMPEEFKDRLLRHLMREIVLNYLLLPTVNLLSDPDYVNQNIIWMCKPNSFTYEFLQQSLRTSTLEEELLSMLEPIDTESNRLRGKDSGGEDDVIIKSQLADLNYLRTICVSQMRSTKDNRGEFGVFDGSDVDDNSSRSGSTDFSAFDAIMDNNTLMTNFYNYLKSINSVQLLDIFHRLTGYRTSTEKYIYHAYLNRPASAGSRPPDWTTLREVANTVFAECEKELTEVNMSGPFSGLRLDGAEEAVRRIRCRFRSPEPPNKDMFEDLRQAVGEILRDERVVAAFKKSEFYVRALVDLGYLPPESLTTGESDVLLDEEDLLKPHIDVLNDEADNISTGSGDTISIGSSGSKSSFPSSQVMSQNMSQIVITANIYKSDLVRGFSGRRRGERTRDSEERAFAVYVINVTRLTETGQEQWEIYRRYSDFDDLHALITEKYPKIPDLKLPPKRAFNNMKHEVVQQRQKDLDTYLKVLLSTNNLERYPELRPIIYQFLEPGVWEKKKGNIVRQVSTIKSTMRSAMANMKQSADEFMDLLMVDKKAETMGVQAQAGKMTLGLSVNDPDEVPLRILLMLVEEVFDSKAHPRRILYQLLKRIVRGFFGNKLNAYIVETAQSLASSEQIAEYIRRMKESIWPNGVLAEPKQKRDQATKMRTRVVCRAKMLGSVSTELAQLIGPVPTRHGMCRLFHLFQHETLNRRFVYVLLEGWLQLMFPDNGLHKLIEKVNDPSLQGRRSVASTGDRENSSRSSKY